MSNTNSTANVKITVSTDGTLKKATQEAAGLRREFEGAQKAATGAARVPRPVSAARAARQLDAGAELGRESGIARSIGAGTGAAGRDFAKQSEGLGGLVRVYATFAANIFAATAAFGALSRAADTSNLVKGLDQLGAASGKNLGSLSKQLIAASDGAISLKDAMSSVAQASSGGMSNTQIVKMGEVAKRAAQALGRDMPDAISRLTRGITKLEPELLDEIGIMIRLDQTSQDYAKSVGKSVSALTMFEKRQAFANAVLAQGAEKFGEIELSANAYSKILASAQNLLQSGLEVVNKVLSPLLNFLSQSPTGLALALTAITGTLLKQAVPAIGTYRKNMKAAADESLVRLSKVYKDQQALTEEADSKAADAASAAFRRQADTVKRLADLKQNAGSFSKTSKKDWNQIAGKNPFEITPEELKSLDERSKRLLNSTDKALQAEGAMMKAHLTDMRSLRQQDDDVHANTQAKIENADSKVWTHKTQLAKIYNRELQQASNRRILALTSETAATMGPVRAWKTLNAEIAKSKAGKQKIQIALLDDQGNQLFKDGKPVFEEQTVKATGRIANGFTRLKGAIGIATSAVSTFMNAFGLWFQVASLAIAAFAIFDGWASKNSKQAAATTAALNTLEESGDNLDRTMDKISRKKPLDSINTESINARAAALENLSDSMKEVLVALENELAAAGTWDKIKDSIAGIFDKDSATKSAKQTAVAISKAFKAALPGKSSAEAEKTIRELLGVDVDNVSGMIAALGKDLDTLGPKAQAAISKMSRELSVAASYAKQLDDAFDTASKSFDAILTSAMPKDNLATLGMDMLNIGKEMTEAFKEPTTALSQLVNTATNISRLKLLNPETAEELFKMGPAIKAGSEELVILQKELKDIQQVQADMYKKREQIEKTVKSRQGNENISQAELEPMFAGQKVGNKVLEDSKRFEKNVKVALALSETKMLTNMKMLTKVQTEVFTNGANLLKNSISIGFEEAAITLKKGWASTLPSNTAGAIKEAAALDRQSISIQQRQVEVSISLIDNMFKLTLQMEKSNILKEREELNSSSFKGSEAYRQERLGTLSIRETAVNNLQNSNPYSGSKGLRQAIKDSNVQTTTPESTAAQLAIPSLLNKEAERAKSAKLSADAKVVTIKEEQRLLELMYEKEKERLALVNSSLEVQKSALGLKFSQLPYLSEEQLIAKQQLDTELLKNKATSDRLTLQGQIAQAEKAQKANPGNKNYITAVEETRKRYMDLVATQNNAEIILEHNKTKEILENAKKEFDTKMSISNTLFSIEINNANTKLTLQEEFLASLEAASAASKTYIAEQNASIALTKEEIRSREALRKIEQDIAVAKQAKSSIESTMQSQGPVDSETLSKATAAQDAQIRAGEVALSNEKAITEAKKATLNVQAQINLLLANQEERMEKIKDFSEGLTGAFGTLGTTIGEVAITITDMLSRQESYGKALEAQQKIIEDTNEAERSRNGATDDQIKAKTKAMEEIAKLTSKNKKMELKDAAEIAGSVKNLFKEKTFAYKAFSAVEKALHLARIAMAIKEAVVAMSTTPTVVAANVAKATSGGITAIIDAMKGIPTPYNFIAGAAMAAYVASILGKSVGGGPKAPPGGFSAEDQQKVQGTGQSYVDGQLVNRGGGALGDPTAKANSIQNSIEKLEEHSFSTMEYSNKMLQNLKAINKNTEVLGAILLQEGFNTKGTNPDGTTQFGTTMAKNPIPTLGALLFGSDSGLGKLSDKISNFVFGGKTTVELQDIGISIRGVIGDIIDSGTNLITTYENIKTSTDGGLFGKDRTDYDTKFKQIENPLIKESIQEMFRDIADTVEEAASVLGKDKGITASLIDSFNIVFKTSFKDLKPEELVDALNSEFSVQFNLLAEKVLPEFQKFRKPAEEFGDTIVRLARNVQVSSLVLESAGLAIGDISKNLRTTTIIDKDGFTVLGTVTEDIGVATVRITEHLVDLFGGLDSLVEKTDFFKDNFLTAAERLAPVQKRVTEEMDRLGLSGIKSRKAFADVVRSLDLATEHGQLLYKELMYVAEGFAEVYPEIEEVTDSLKDMIKATGDLIDSFNKLMMTEEEYYASKTKDMTPEQKARSDINRGLEKSIEYAQQFLKLGADADKLITDMTADSFDTRTLAGQIDKLRYSRSKEAAGIAAVNMPLYNLITGLMELKTSIAFAAQAAASAASQLRSMYSNQVSMVASLKAGVVQDYKSSVSRVEAAQKAVAAAQQSAAEAAAQAAAETAANMAAAAQDARNALIDLSTSIKEFLKELVASEQGLGSPKEKLASLQSQFNETLTKAKSGDQESIGKLPEISQKLLESAKEQSSSKLDYMKIYGKVTNELNGISAAIDKVNGTVKTDVSYSSGGGGGGDYGLAEAMKELADAVSGKDALVAKALAKGITLDELMAEELDNVVKYGTESEALLKMTTDLEGFGEEFIDVLKGTTPVWEEAMDAYKENTKVVKDLTDKLPTYTSQLGTTIETVRSSLGTLTGSFISAAAAIDSAATSATNAINSIPDTKSIMPVDDRKTTASITTPTASNEPHYMTSGWADYTWTDNPDFASSGFASGGMHSGGLRIVGEQGPELEATGPSRIWNAQETSNFLKPTIATNNNDALIAEIRMLRQQVAALTDISASTAQSSDKTAKVLNRVTQGGTAMQTAA